MPSSAPGHRSQSRQHAQVLAPAATRENDGVLGQGGLSLLKVKAMGAAGTDPGPELCHRASESRVGQEIFLECLMHFLAGLSPA